MAHKELHQCTKCLQSFQTEIDLNGHYKKVHQKILKCHSCKSIFYNQGSLTQHIKKIHSGGAKRNKIKKVHEKNYEQKSEIDIKESKIEEEDLNSWDTNEYKHFLAD